MTPKRRNIALLLCWIFIFPIVFQSLHIIASHPEVHGHHHEISLDYSPGHVVQYNLTVDSQSVKSCHICAYHLSINDMPITSILSGGLLLVQDLIKELVINLPFQLLGFNKSPRAPPVFR